jgi:hypothetical protein
MRLSAAFDHVRERREFSGYSPDVLPLGALKHAVRVDHLVLDPRTQAVAAIGIEDDRPDVFLDQFVLDYSGAR